MQVIVPRRFDPRGCSLGVLCENGPNFLPNSEVGRTFLPNEVLSIYTIYIHACVLFLFTDKNTSRVSHEKDRPTPTPTRSILESWGNRRGGVSPYTGNPWNMVELYLYCIFIWCPAPGDKELLTPSFPFRSVWLYMTCRGCHSRLELPVGSSGFCDCCYLVVRAERVVFTRYPSSKAGELCSYLAKVVTTLESDGEAFEADRTAGLVDWKGYIIVQEKEGKTRVKTAYESGEHPGERHPAAAPARAYKPRQHSRRRREERDRTRSRSRRRERKARRGDQQQRKRQNQLGPSLRPKKRPARKKRRSATKSARTTRSPETLRRRGYFNPEL